MRGLLHKAAIHAERTWDALRPGRTVRSPYIDPFIGYTTQDKVIVRGRVLDGKPVIDDGSTGTTWQNVRLMAARFRTREIAGAEISVGGITTRSDEEGYFLVELPRTEPVPAEVKAHLTGFGVTASLPVFCAKPDARFGVISDIDDTLIRTDAWSLKRNIYNTLTGNAASRHVFPDSVELIDRLHAGINPVFYVSSSPWNLHAFLLQLFERNGLVTGPLFLRDFGISEGKFIKGTHGEHKLAMIDTIMNANRGLKLFVLIGDTGQHDPEVYHRAIRKHEGRVSRVAFRMPDGRLDAKDEKWIGRIREAGIPVHVDTDFRGLLRELAADGTLEA